MNNFGNTFGEISHCRVELSCDLIVIAAHQMALLSTVYISLCSDKNIIVEQSI